MRRRKQVVTAEKKVKLALFFAVFVLSLIVLTQPSQTGLVTASLQGTACPQDITIGRQEIPQQTGIGESINVIGGETRDNILLQAVGSIFAEDAVYNGDGIFGTAVRVDVPAAIEEYNRYVIDSVTEDGLSYVVGKRTAFFLGRGEDNLFSFFIPIVNFFPEEKEVTFKLNVKNSSQDIVYTTENLGIESITVPAATITTSEGTTTCTAGTASISIPNPLPQPQNNVNYQEGELFVPTETGWHTVELELVNADGSTITDQSLGNNKVITRFEVLQTKRFYLSSIPVLFIQDPIDTISTNLDNMWNSYLLEKEFIERTYPLAPNRIIDSSRPFGLESGFLTVSPRQLSTNLRTIITRIPGVISGDDFEVQSSTNLSAASESVQDATFIYIINALEKRKFVTQTPSFNVGVLPPNYYRGIKGIVFPNVSDNTLLLVANNYATIQASESYRASNRPDPIYNFITLAHEMGHLLGLPGSVYRADEEYETPHEFNNCLDEASEVFNLCQGFTAPGMDLYDRFAGSKEELLKTSEYRNFMGGKRLGSGTSWVASPSYKRLLQELLEEEADLQEKRIQENSIELRSHDNENMLFLRIGFFGADSSEVFDSGFKQVSRELLLANESEGYYRIQVLDTSENVLFDGGISQFFEWEIFRETEEGGSFIERVNKETGLMEVYIPLPENAQHIVLKTETGTELWRLPVSESMPNITLVSPTQPVTIDFETGTLILEWTATDTDSSPLYFNIYYDTGNGLFIPYAFELQAEDFSQPFSVSFPGNKFAPGATYQFKIEASDGIWSNEVITAPVTISGTPVTTETRTRELPAGFSLIGLGLENASITDARSLRDASSCPETLIIYYYENGWNIRISGTGIAVGPNFPITTQDAIWYHCATPSTLQYTGDTLPETAELNLQTGFNYKTLPVNTTNGMRINTLMNQINTTRGVTCGTAYQFVQNFFRIHTTNLPNFNNYTINEGEGIIIQCPAGGTTEIRAT